MRFLPAFLMTLVVLAGGAAQAATEVGAVSRARGECLGKNEGAVRSLDRGVPVHLGEEVSTGDAARLEVTFEDGSVLTLGERARVVIDAFVFRRANGLERLILSASGPFRLATGTLVSPAAAIGIDTPTASIGVRGTDFWGGPIDGQFGVLVLEGVVTVTNAAGQVVLDQPGEGVNLDGPDIPPDAVTQWPADKVERALETIRFN